MCSPTLSLDRLRAQLRGSLALAGEPGYALARPWNLAVEVLPCAVAAVAGDVAEVVRFAGTAGDDECVTLLAPRRPQSRSSSAAPMGA